MTELVHDEGYEARYGHICRWRGETVVRVGEALLPYFARRPAHQILAQKF